MKRQTIKKSIDIHASKEKVWDVFMQDNLNRIWYEAFGEGVHAETDWKAGSKALFTDNTRSGLIGKIITNKPHEVLSIEYEGMVMNDVEDYDSDIARGIKGGHETYHLSETDGVTHVDIACDTSEDYFEMMSSAWDKALKKIKALSESK